MDSPAKAIIQKFGLQLDIKTQNEALAMDAAHRLGKIMNWQLDHDYLPYMDTMWGDWDIWKHGEAMEE